MQRVKSRLSRIWAGRSESAKGEEFLGARADVDVTGVADPEPDDPHRLRGFNREEADLTAEPSGQVGGFEGDLGELSERSVSRIREAPVTDWTMWRGFCSFVLRASVGKSLPSSACFCCNFRAY